MRFWPVGDYYDNTTRVVVDPDCLELDCVSGFSTEVEAGAVIRKILAQQRKPHHVTYRVEPALNLGALQASGVLV
jgi:hypothetical protein